MSLVILLVCSALVSACTSVPKDSLGDAGLGEARAGGVGAENYRESTGTDDTSGSATGSATTPTPATPVPTTTAPPPPGIYVDSTNGADDGDGSFAAPLRQPAAAFALAQPGDTIFFRAGTYDDRTSGVITGRLVGTPDAWIELRPFPGDEVTIVAGGEWGDGIDLRASQFVLVEGFTLLGRDDSIHGTGIRMRENSHDIVVQYNTVENFGHAGIAGARSSRMTIQYNEVRHNAKRSFYQGSGITLWEAQGPGNESDEFSNVIRGNLIAQNYTETPGPTGRITDGNCIIIDFFATHGFDGSTLVETNTCVDNGGRGIHILLSPSVTVRNNTLIGNGWTPELVGSTAEVNVFQSPGVLVANNLIINSPSVIAINTDAGSQTVVVSNAVANGAAPAGSGNYVLVGTDSVLASVDASGQRGSHRPANGSSVVLGSDSATQSTIDGCGVLRPTPATIGAFEPSASNSC